MLNDSNGLWHFWITFIGTYLIYFPMHYLGFLGMPRRYYEYQDYQFIPESAHDLNAFMLRAQYADWRSLTAPLRPLAEPWPLWINTGLLIGSSAALQWARVAAPARTVARYAARSAAGRRVRYCLFGRPIMSMAATIRPGLWRRGQSG